VTRERPGNDDLIRLVEWESLHDGLIDSVHQREHDAFKNIGEVAGIQNRHVHRSVGVAVREIDRFREAADAFARTPVNAAGFFSDLMDAVLDITAAGAAKGADALAAILARGDAERQLIAKAKQRQIDSREELLDDMLARYESDRCGVGGIRGTAWAVFNAVTEHADYVQPRRQVGTAEERLSRQWELP
jgi:hypothetical protein